MIISFLNLFDFMQRMAIDGHIPNHASIKC